MIAVRNAWLEDKGEFSLRRVSLGFKSKYRGGCWGRTKHLEVFQELDRLSDLLKVHKAVSFPWMVVPKRVGFLGSMV